MPENAMSVAPAGEAGSPGSIADLPQFSSSPDSGAPVDEGGAVDSATEEQQQPVEAVEFDESSIQPLEADPNFADEDYARAAAHYSKQFGFKFDTNDPAHRAMLREYISRGQRIASLQSSQAPVDETAADDAEQAEPQEQVPQLDTPEQVTKFLHGVRDYAAKSVRPEVANFVAKEFISAMYGPKEAEKVTPEGAVRFTQAMQTMGLLMLNDVLPQMAPKLFEQYVGQNFPMLSDMHSTQLEQRAVKDLSSAKGQNGQAAYPGLDKLIADGTVEAVYRENPELRGGQFYNTRTGQPLSPLDNKKRELHVVYQMARGRAVNPALLQQVADTAAQRATQRARTVNASKLAAGESKGNFQQGGGSYIENLQRARAESAGNRFSEAAKQSESFQTFLQRKAGKS